MGKCLWLASVFASGCLMSNPEWDGVDTESDDSVAGTTGETPTATSGPANTSGPATTDEPGRETMSAGQTGTGDPPMGDSGGPLPEEVWYSPAAGGCLSDVTSDPTACEGQETETGQWLVSFDPVERYGIVLKFSQSPEYAGREVIAAEVKLFPVSSGASPGTLFPLAPINLGDLMMMFPEPVGPPVSDPPGPVVDQQWVHFPLEVSVVQDQENMYFGVYPGETFRGPLFYSSIQGVQSPALVVTYAPATD